jgi:hypothetical protein
MIALIILQQTKSMIYTFWFDNNLLQQICFWSRTINRHIKSLDDQYNNDVVIINIEKLWDILST